MSDTRPPMRRWLKRILIPLAILITLPVGFYFYAQWQGERDLQAALAELDASGEEWRWEEIALNRPPLSEGNDANALLARVFALGIRVSNAKYRIREQALSHAPNALIPA